MFVYRVLITRTDVKRKLPYSAVHRCGACELKYCTGNSNVYWSCPLLVQHSTCPECWCLLCAQFIFPIAAPCLFTAIRAKLFAGIRCTNIMEAKHSLTNLSSINDYYSRFHQPLWRKNNAGTGEIWRKITAIASHNWMWKRKPWFQPSRRRTLHSWHRRIILKFPIICLFLDAQDLRGCSSVWKFVNNLTLWLALGCHSAVLLKKLKALSIVKELSMLPFCCSPLLTLRLTVLCTTYPLAVVIEVCTLLVFLHCGK